MIYKPGAKVKFKIGTGFKCGVILGRNRIDHPDFPYHVKSDDHNDYWISEDSIVAKESELKYKVGDRVRFKFIYGGRSEHTGTIIHVEDCSRYPYKIRNDYDGNTYSANDDNILGCVEGLKPKYKVGDRVRFKYPNYCPERTGTIDIVDNSSRHSYIAYVIHDDIYYSDTYFIREDEILGYAEEKTDYTVFYSGRRPGKSGVLYCKKDVEAMTDMYRRILDTGAYLPKIKKVIFNDPATIVFWEDGTKTVVKAQTSVSGQVFADGKSLIDLTKTDLFDPEKGLAMAIAKKALGNQGNYYDEFKKWLP